MKWILLLLAVPMFGQAAIYKCPDSQGRITFSDRPCAGAVESPEHQVDIDPPAPTVNTRRSSASAAQDAKWEEAKRFYYVEIPQLERKAIELMASPDPARQALGREMAWKAQQGREAFKELERARERSAATKRRYDDAQRRIGGY